MRTPLACIAAAVLAVLAGCSSTVSGSVAMTTAPAPAGEVDLTLLDPGNYPTKPRPPLGTAGDTHNGAFLEGPLIDQFQPTPIDQLKNLPIDPDGLLARTLPPDKDNGAVYGLRAQLHFDSDPLGSQTTFDAAHLQQVTQSKANVYQTPDAASAQKIADGFVADIAEKGFGDEKTFVPGAGIKGLPTAKCLVHKDTKAAESYFYCLAVADRYAIEVSAAQELDAHQRVSAQYLMLTGD